MTEHEGNERRVLIAEDDPVSRKLLEKTLEKIGYDVISCTNGEEALKTIRSESIPILITDWMMPRMDGPELCRRIREYEANPGDEQAENGERNGRHCFIIMLTAKSEVEDIVEGIDAGADDFVAKPFDSKELRVRMKAGERRLSLEKQLVEANRRLKEADLLKSEFVSIMSHDLGTPMTVIKSFAQILLTPTMGELNEQQKRAMNKIIEGIDRLDHLRKDTLEIARLDLGKIELKKDEVSVREIIDDSVSGLRSLADSKKQDLKVEVEGKLASRCDRGKIAQVVENYIANAIRYTQEEGHVVISGREEDGMIHFSVSDNGRGIPKGEEENVFKRFYRVGEKVEGSTGLGLSIVKSIIEAHGGRAWCESREGEGSTFHCTIPKD